MSDEDRYNRAFELLRPLYSVTRACRLRSNEVYYRLTEAADQRKLFEIDYTLSVIDVCFRDYFEYYDREAFKSEAYTDIMILMEVTIATLNGIATKLQDKSGPVHHLLTHSNDYLRSESQRILRTMLPNVRAEHERMFAGLMPWTDEQGSVHE